MVTVAKNYFGIKIFLKIPLKYPLDSSPGSDGHKYGGGNCSVTGFENAGSCFCIFVP